MTCLNVVHQELGPQDWQLIAQSAVLGNVKTLEMNIHSTEGFHIVRESQQLVNLVEIKLSAVCDHGTNQFLATVDLTNVRNPITVDSLQGMQHTTPLQQTLTEILIIPSLFPDLFRGNRRPYGGILLFGPSGCGKTTLVESFLTHCTAAVISMNATCLNRFKANSERIMRSLFDMARQFEASVMVMDEMDAVACDSDSTEHRRVVTELMIQIDNACRGVNDTDSRMKQFTLIGISSHPDRIHSAVRRRLEKRIYMELPDFPTRISFFKRLFIEKQHEFSIHLSDEDVELIAQSTQNYSFQDMEQLVKQTLQNLSCNNKSVTLQNFTQVISQFQPCNTSAQLEVITGWKVVFSD